VHSINAERKGKARDEKRENSAVTRPANIREKQIHRLKKVSAFTLSIKFGVLQMFVQNLILADQLKKRIRILWKFLGLLQLDWNNKTEKDPKLMANMQTDHRCLAEDLCLRQKSEDFQA
jgi:hypothetical protein